MHKIIRLSIIFLLATPALMGQKLVNSPYARFGLGILEPQGMLKSRSMGGAAIALRDPTTINYLNPASLSSVDTNSFVFDLGLEYQINLLSNADENYLSDDVNFHHLAMAFPISRRMGFAIGMVPFSNGYYNLQESIIEGDPQYDPLIGDLLTTNKREGSYNKYFIGLGISPFNGFSVGGSISFLLGEIDRTTTYNFIDDSKLFNNIRRESIIVRGYNFDFGAQYTATFKNDYFATAGVSLISRGKYNAEYEDIFVRTAPYQASEYSIDTMSFTTDLYADIEIPRTLGLGLSFGKKDKFTVSADYSTTNWDLVSFLVYDSYLTKSNSFRLGGEFIPEKYANYAYFRRVEYRLGGHISDSYLMLNGEQLKEFGITFGAGLPMNRSKSKVNLHFEFASRRGSFANDLHNENYLTFGISLNLYDYWFIKRKYD